MSDMGESGERSARKGATHHLKEALEAEDMERTNYHLKEALQLLNVDAESDENR